MTRPDIPAGQDEIDALVKVIVLEQVVYFQDLGFDPAEVMSALRGSTYRIRPDGWSWADVAGLTEDVYREDQGLPAKRNHQYSVPRYKNGFPV